MDASDSNCGDAATRSVPSRRDALRAVGGAVLAVTGKRPQTQTCSEPLTSAYLPPLTYAPAMAFPDPSVLFNTPAMFPDPAFAPFLYPSTLADAAFYASLYPPPQAADAASPPGLEFPPGLNPYDVGFDIWQTAAACAWPMYMEAPLGDVDFNTVPIANSFPVYVEPTVEKEDAASEGSTADTTDSCAASPGRDSQGAASSDFEFSSVESPSMASLAR